MHHFLTLGLNSSENIAVILTVHMLSHMTTEACVFYVNVFCVKPNPGSTLFDGWVNGWTQITGPDVYKGGT